MPIPEVKPEEQQAELTEDEINAQLRDEAYEEIDKPEIKDELPKGEEEEFSFEDEQEETPPKESQDNPEGEETDDTDEIKDEVPNEEDSQEEPEPTEANLKEITEKYNVTEDDARAIIKQQKHYKDDPIQVAKALLNSQRGYSKLESEMKALKEKNETPVAKEVSIDDVSKYIKSKQYIVNGTCLTEEDIVSEYVKEHPELTEDLTDDKVFALACRDIRDLTNKDARKKVESLPIDAKARRLELKSNLKDAVPEEYHAEMKETIDAVTDNQLMDERFDLAGLAILIKGKHYDADVAKIRKEEYEKGLKDGRQNSKIVTPPVGGSNGSVKGARSSVIKFTEDQTERMESMFGSTTMSSLDKRVAYITTYSEEFTDAQVKWAIKKDKELGGNK